MHINYQAEKIDTAKTQWETLGGHFVYWHYEVTFSTVLSWVLGGEILD